MMMNSRERERTPVRTNEDECRVVDRVIVDFKVAKFGEHDRF